MINRKYFMCWKQAMANGAIHNTSAIFDIKSWFPNPLLAHAEARLIMEEFRLESAHLNPVDSTLTAFNRI